VCNIESSCARASVWHQKLFGIQKNWDELRRDGMRREVSLSRRTFIGDIWKEMRWHEKTELKRGHRHKGRQSRDEMTCDEVWSAAHDECNVKGEVHEVWSVKSDESVRLALRCAGVGCSHVLGQQQRNSFAQSTHARAWLAHGACKFYRWERFYSITLRQLLPRLVRALLVHFYDLLFCFTQDAAGWFDFSQLWFRKAST